MDGCEGQILSTTSIRVKVDGLGDVRPGLHNGAVPDPKGDPQAIPSLAKDWSNPENTARRAEIEAELARLVTAASKRRVTPTPEASARVQAVIDALHPEGLGNWPMRACKEELNALGVFGTRALFFYSVRADGTVFEMDLDTFAHRAEAVTSRLTRFAVIVTGAMSTPELAGLIPRPPRGTRACGLCFATGGEERDCARCCGFGWYRETGSQ